MCNQHQRHGLSHLTVISSDIGHVDFLEAVHKLAVKPYIIVGLHFDQVSLIYMMLQLLRDLQWRCNTLSLCFTGGKSLQGKELPHHERPRKDAQRLGLSSTLFLILSTLPAHHTLTLRVSFADFMLFFFSTVRFRSGDWCSFCSHQRFAGPFQG